MEDLGFWNGFFSAYQAQPDWLKFLWLVVPPLFAFAALFLLQRLALKRIEHKLTGNLVYSMTRDEFDAIRVYLHGPEADGPGRETIFDTAGTIRLLDRMLTDRREDVGQAENKKGD